MGDDLCSHFNDHINFKGNIMKIDQKWVEQVFDSVAAKGPKPKDYVKVCYAFHWVRKNIDDYRGFTEQHVIKPMKAHLASHPYASRAHPYNLITHIWDKPRGYNGDGDLLQKMYDCFELPDADEEAQPRNPYVKTLWDHFICAKPEMLSVQHRKAMFQRQLNRWIQDGASSFVDLGCGNGSYTRYAYKRFVELLPPHWARGSVIGCDLDPQVLTNHSPDNEVLWFQGNLVKTLPEAQCDIVYSGGLFDYFSDGIFERMLDRIKVFEPKFIMIGNIDQSKSTKAMMECLGWELFDRSRFDLVQLGINNFPKEWTIDVETDLTGHQHFLKVTR
jgi:SAM-dependent methyltransferase